MTWDSINVNYVHDIIFQLLVKYQKKKKKKTQKNVTGFKGHNITKFIDIQTIGNTLMH